MVFEDAHWSDPTPRELIDLIVERISSLPVLLIVTFRSEFQLPWTGQPKVTMVAPNRLDRRGRTALVEQITSAKTSPGRSWSSRSRIALTLHNRGLNTSAADRGPSGRYSAGAMLRSTDSRVQLIRVPEGERGSQWVPAQAGGPSAG